VLYTDTSTTTLYTTAGFLGAHRGVFVYIREFDFDICKQQASFLGAHNSKGRPCMVSLSLLGALGAMVVAHHLQLTQPDINQAAWAAHSSLGISNLPSPRPRQAATHTQMTS
jgi:hypothetical protein